ncbi:MFS transporter [Dactylosporangium sp. McL0621]|uniref:MFS transporter n=1 Tax=Dactylosporangium sp. McL0621 TaxID=3415678 RepID=UPI003CEF2BE0
MGSRRRRASSTPAWPHPSPERFACSGASPHPRPCRSRRSAGHRRSCGRTPTPRSHACNRQFRVLTASYLTVAITMNLVLAAMPYFAEYELGRAALTTVLIAAFMAPAVLATPLWVLVARRFGKQRSLLTAQAAFVAGSLVLALGAAAGLPLLIAAVTVLGVAFAAMQLMPLSMVPDVVAAAGPAGTAGAGSYTGVWTAAEATGSALGPYVYSACLAAGGFVASTAGEHAAQSSGALTAIRYGFTLVPAVLMTIAIALQRRYTLDGRAHTTAPRTVVRENALE